MRRAVFAHQAALAPPQRGAVGVLLPVRLSAPPLVLPTKNAVLDGVRRAHQHAPLEVHVRLRDGPVPRPAAVLVEDAVKLRLGLGD